MEILTLVLLDEPDWMLCRYLEAGLLCLRSGPLQDSSRAFAAICAVPVAVCELAAARAAGIFLSGMAVDGARSS